MSEYTKVGIIISCVEKEGSKGKYKSISIMPDGETQVIHTNAFDNKVNLDLIDEGASFTFYLEQNGQFTNLNRIDEVPDGKQMTLSEEQKKAATSTHYDNISKPKSTKIEEDDYIMLNGKKYTTHKGLLNNAYKKGLKSIITEFISYENDTAVMKSTVTMADDTVFTAYGDANPTNVNHNIAKHLIRMAETRATNRALRLATNQAETSIEELGGVSNEQSK